MKKLNKIIKNKAKHVPDEKIPDFLIEVVGNHQS